MDICDPLFVASKFKVTTPEAPDASSVTLVEPLPVIVLLFKSKEPEPVTTTLVRSLPVMSAELSSPMALKAAR